MEPTGQKEKRKGGKYMVQQQVEREMAQIDGNGNKCRKLCSMKKSHQWPTCFEMECKVSVCTNI